MGKKYIITEKELIDLLAGYHELNALSENGVDNWGDYGEGFDEYLTDDDGLEHDGFVEFAETMLVYYEEA